MTKKRKKTRKEGVVELLWVRRDEGVHRSESYVRRGKPPLRCGKLLWIGEEDVSIFGPSMAHVPKTINRGFQDKYGVRTLRGSNLEKMRGTNGKTNIDSWKIL